MNTISNPYIGPRTFTEDERDRFYGREREADELLARVLSEQEVVFYAQSGAGKSSLVNTCLIPQLREDGIEVLLGRVGGEAPAGLEVDNIFVFNLLRSLSTSDVNADKLAKGSLTEFLIPAAEGRVSKRRALIIDQFEEIFSTHAEAWEKRKGFFKQLAHALKADRRMRVVLVMREDYIASLDPYARLLPGRFQVRYYMQRLEYAAALKAVTEPVKGGDFSRPYEAGVAEKLVDDLRSVKVYKSDGTEAMEPGQYVEPVQLQVVCFNLWENLPAGGTQITEQDLQNLDDVSASFVSASLGKYYAMRVKAVAEPKQVDERRIREWFTGKLISPTGVRNMVLQERGGKSGGLENDVIQALSDLVRAETRGGAIFYELTHDRLVEPIIANNRTWFERNLQNLSPLQQQAALWNAQDRAVSWLVSDQALTEVEQWAKDHPDKLTQLEEDFLEASRMNQYEQDEKRRLAREARTKRQLTIAIVVAVMTLALAAFGGLSAREALRQAATAQAASTLAAQAEADSNQAAIISRSRELAVQAELLNRLDSDLDQAILLSIEAFQADDNPKTLSSLFTSLQKSADIRRILDANEADYLQFGSDGNTVAVSNEEGITLQDLDGDILGGPFPGPPSSIFSTSFSPNGETLAASSKDGSILLWETEGWSPLGNALTDHVDWTNNVIFTADGKTLISLSDDGNIILWDITHRDKPVNLSTEATGDAVNDAILNPKVPDILVSTDRIGSIILWDISKRDDPVLINKFDHNELHTIVDMAFSEDGQLLASGDLDGTMVLWDFSKPRTPEVFATEQESNVAIHCVAISWDGNVLVAGNEDGSINLWDISNPRDPFLIGEPLVLHEGIVNSLAFSPDGRTFASGSFDGKVLLWDLAEREVVTELTGGIDFTGFLSPVNSVKFNPEGDLLVAGLENGSIVLWEVSDRGKPVQAGKRLQGHSSKPHRAEFTEDGRFLILFSSVPRLYEDIEVSSIVDARHRTMIGAGSLKFKDPNGKLIVFQVYDADQAVSHIKLFDPSTGNTIGNPIPGGFLSINTDKGIIAFQTNDERGRAAINLWDLSAQEQIGNPVEGRFLALSQDGELLVYSNSEDDTDTNLINILNITTREEIRFPLIAEFIALSSTNKNLVYRSTNDTGESVIYVRDILSGVVIVDPFVGYNPIPSPNGSILLYQTFDDLGNTSFQLLNSETGFPIGDPFTADTYYFPPAFSPEGNIVSYQTSDNGSYNFNFLNAFSGEQVGGTIPGEFLIPHWAGKTLVFEIGGSAGPRIVLIDMTDSQQIGPTIVGQYRALTEDGKTLIYQDDSGIKKLDVLSSGSGAAPEETVKAEFESISADGNVLVVRNGDTIQIRDLNRPAVPGVHLTDPVSQGNIQTAALSPDVKTLAIFSDGEILLQHSDTRAVIGQPFNDHFAGFTLPGGLPMFSPDGNILVITNNDARVTTLWDISTGKQIGEEIKGEFLVLSPDGKTLKVSDYLNSVITIWDVNSGKQIGEETFDSYLVPSPDGKTLAVGDYSTYTVTLSDANTEEQIGDEIDGGYPVFSLDSKTLTVLNNNTGHTILWDVKTGKQIGDEIPGTSSVFSPDGTMLAVGDHNTYTVTLWDVNSGEQIGDKIQGDSYVFSPAETLLAVTDPSASTVTLWDTRTGKQIGDDIPGTSSVFSPDGMTLAVGNYKAYTVTLWDVNTGKQIGHEVEGDSYVFSPKGNILAITDSTGSTIALWETRTGKQIGDEIPGTSSLFSPDGTMLAVGDHNTYTVTLWDVNSGEQIGDKIQGDSYVFSPKGNILAITDSTGSTIALWDVNTQEQTVRPRVTTLPNGIVSSLQFSPDGMTLASIGDDGIILTDVRTQQKIAGPFPGRSVVFGPNGNMIAIPKDANDTILRNISTGTQKSISGSNPIFSPDGLVIATRDQDNVILFWNLNMLTKMNTDPIYGSNVLFNGDGSIAAVVEASRIGLWEVSTKSAGSIRFFNESPCPVALEEGCTFFAAFNPDGKTLAYTDGAQLLLWDPANNNVPPDPLGHASGRVASLAYIQDGQFLISEDFNGGTTIWDSSTHTSLGPPVPGSFKVSGFNSNSNTFLIESAGHWFLWKFDPEDWITQLCYKVGRNFTPEEWANYFPGESFRRTCSS